MAHKNKYPGIDPRITRIIAQQVGKLAGRHGITYADLADIEQDLHIKVHLSYLNPLDRAFERHVQQIVNHAVIDMIRYRERECRDWRREAFSLDDDSLRNGDDEDGDDVGIDLPEDALIPLGYPPSWQSRRCAQADLVEGMARLSGDLRDMAEALAACGGNVCEAGRMLGLSRKTARTGHNCLKPKMAWLRNK